MCRSTFTTAFIIILILMIPVAFVLVNFTSLSIMTIYPIVQLLIIINYVAGVILVKKGVWIKNIVEDK